MHRTALSMSSTEVTMTTGMWRSFGSAFSCSRTWYPSSPGISTSKRMTSNPSARTRSSASSPSFDVVTRWPRCSRLLESIERVTGSSSTTRIDACSAVMSQLLANLLQGLGRSPELVLDPVHQRRPPLERPGLGSRFEIPGQVGEIGRAEGGRVRLQRVRRSSDLLRIALACSPSERFHLLRDMLEEGIDQASHGPGVSE